MWLTCRLPLPSIRPTTKASSCWRDSRVGVFCCWWDSRVGVFCCIIRVPWIPDSSCIFIVSCSATSSDAFARITPVSPPIVNSAIKPSANSIGVVIRIDPPNSVAIQLKILIPVGTAIIIVAAVK